MPSANSKLHDAAIDHEVDLHHYANGVVRKIIALLNRTDADLAQQLAAVLERLPPEAFTVERLDSLLLSVRVLNAKAYQAVGADLSTEMRDLAKLEAGFQLQLFQDALPVTLVLHAVSPEAAYAAAMARPFQGRLLKEWTTSLEADRMVRIRDQVRIGYVEGQATGDIVRRIRGTRARQYEDGVIQIDRRHAESVVRTAVSHTAGTARDQFYERNQDIVKALAWTSTLDSRTSEICRVRDGKQYDPKTHEPIGHKLEWLGGPGRAHWCCRSTAVPVLKSWKELGGAADIEEFSPATRASMDGQVPADTTFAEWLRKQSAARQDQILGRTRGDLFRRGTPLDGFYNDKGRYLTLEELGKRGAPPPKLPPTPPPQPRWDQGVEAGKWHAKAFDAAPPWLRDAVVREQAVQVTFGGGTAHAVRGQSIEMGQAQVTRDGKLVEALDTADRQSVWRHEFGHILDARLASGLYRSSERDFPPAQHQDSVLLQVAAARGRPSKALTAAQQQREADYTSARELIVDASDRDARENALQALANRAGVDYKQFKALVAESTEIDAGSGIGSQVRLGSMLVAIQRGDAEEFLRQAMFMTTADKQPGNDWKVRERSWRKDGSFAALSDLVGSATKNKVASYNEGFSGHSDGYYAQAAWFAPTESFANLTALAGHPNAYWWELVKRFTPHMAREFEQIIGKAAGNG